MHVSPYRLRSTLYRSAVRGVTLAVVVGQLALVAFGQFTPQPKKEKQPRALGLVEIPVKGKPRIIPIAILIDGEFYDASAYKANPVPMALDSGTVYEAVRSGVSQGLFTVKGALHGNNTWIAEGSWRSAEEIQAEAAKKKAPALTKGPSEDADARPVLRRSGDKAGSLDSKASESKSSTTTGSDSKPSDSKPADSKTPSAAGAPPSLNSPAGGTPPSPPPPPSSTPDTTSHTSNPSSNTVPAATAPTGSSSASSDASQPPEDKNRPALRRGKPTASQEDAKDEVGSAPAAAATYSPVKAKPVNTPMYSTSVPAGSQVFPAISDADGPEPRPYNYEMKPEEEQKFLKKMLGLASIEVQGRAKQLAAATEVTSAQNRPAHPTAHPSKAAKPPDFDFKDVQLRVFDLSNSNEPVLVLMANAQMPKSAKQTASPDLQYMVTIVAREDIYGDLHKAYANVTDSQHLDVLPRVELVDAVDADGDGRGELLFRRVSDAGSAFVIDRVIGNQLWPLFQGTPQ